MSWENHFEVKVEGKATYPDWAMNNMVGYLNTVSQASG